jgi:chromosome segregation ATPase
MKIIAALFLAIALTCAPTHAQTIEQKLTTILSAQTSTADKIGTVHDLLQEAANTRASLRAEGANGQAKLDDLNAQIANFGMAIKRHNAEATQHDAAMDAHDARTAQHNATQCTYEEGHPEQCAGYIAEQRVLDQEANTLDRESDDINREKETLTAAGEGLQIEIDDFNKFKDDFNARNDENEHNIDVLMRVLGMLQHTTAACQDVLQNPKSTPEQIHEACGQGFDGNDDHAPLTRTGTGCGSSNGPRQ